MWLRVALLLILFVADRVIKRIIWLRPPADGYAGGFLNPVLNKNLAFSLNIPDVVTMLLIPILSIIVLILIVLTVRYFIQKDKQFVLWGLVSIGALSNVIDRISFGGVLDYIDLGIWPVFNLSDVFIFIGVVGLIGRELFLKKKHSST
jgi:lipoprotein signal peptidase